MPRMPASSDKLPPIGAIGWSHISQWQFANHGLCSRIGVSTSPVLAQHGCDPAIDPIPYPSPSGDANRGLRLYHDCTVRYDNPRGSPRGGLRGTAPLSLALRGCNPALNPIPNPSPFGDTNRSLRLYHDRQLQFTFHLSSPSPSSPFFIIFYAHLLTCQLSPFLSTSLLPFHLPPPSYLIPTSALLAFPCSAFIPGLYFLHTLPLYPHCWPCCSATSVRFLTLGFLHIYLPYPYICAAGHSA